MLGQTSFEPRHCGGLGQRIFFLHDGRTTDLIEAIEAHERKGNKQYPASEANAVIARSCVVCELVLLSWEGA